MVLFAGCSNRPQLQNPGLFQEKNQIFLRPLLSRPAFQPYHIRLHRALIHALAEQGPFRLTNSEESADLVLQAGVTSYNLDGIEQSYGYNAESYLLLEVALEMRSRHTHGSRVSRVIALVSLQTAASGTSIFADTLLQNLFAEAGMKTAVQVSSYWYKLLQKIDHPGLEKK